MKLSGIILVLFLSASGQARPGCSYNAWDLAHQLIEVRPPGTKLNGPHAVEPSEVPQNIECPSLKSFEGNYRPLSSNVGDCKEIQVVAHERGRRLEMRGFHTFFAINSVGFIVSLQEGLQEAKWYMLAISSDSRGNVSEAWIPTFNPEHNLVSGYRQAQFSQAGLVTIEKGIDEPSEKKCAYHKL